MIKVHNAAKITHLAMLPSRKTRNSRVFIGILQMEIAGTAQISNLESGRFNTSVDLLLFSKMETT
jgi:hypothetical protein